MRYALFFTSFNCPSCLPYKISEKSNGALKPFNTSGGQVLDPAQPLRHLSRLLWDPLLEKVHTLSQHDIGNIFSF